MKLKRYPYSIDYEELISMVEAEQVSFDFLSKKNYDTTKKYYCIRHDMDYEFENALIFSKFEYDKNIKSTYFLLPTADYFDYSNKFIKECRLIQDRGHNIAYHNNLLVQFFKQKGKETIDSFLSKHLNFFRKNGINISGSSAHGDGLCYEVNKHRLDISILRKYGIYVDNKPTKNSKSMMFSNYQVWKEFDPLKNESSTIGSFNFPKPISMYDYDLFYETYFLDYDAYFTDSGLFLNGMIISDKFKVYERTMLRSPQNISIQSIHEFNTMDSGVLQVLIHPREIESI